MLQVVDAGVLATIQDAGRPAYTDVGVPIGGACDPWSLAVANALQGNDPAAPVLEITLAGPVFEVRGTCAVALAGADLGARVEGEYRLLAPGRVHLLRDGTRFRFAARRHGARAYLALAGGVTAPIVLGSASTCLPGEFGGLDGRPLRAGDRLLPRRPGDLERAGLAWPDELAVAGLAWPEESAAAQDPTQPWVVHVVEGPHAAQGAPGALEALCSREWEIGAASDRTGLRLAGPPLPTAPGQGELVSTGTVWGAVQLPPDGAPIVLLADAPPVGGYPVPAVAARADWPVLGQLAPGDRVRFVRVTIEQAQRRCREQRQALERGTGLLARAEPWDDLVGRAGG